MTLLCGLGIGFGVALLLGVVLRLTWNQATAKTREDVFDEVWLLLTLRGVDEGRASWLEAAGAVDRYQQRTKRKS